jgi:hypothetical protein
MKKQNFVKLLMVLLAIVLITGGSCVKKLCFIGNTGTVTVTNNTGRSAYVTVKSGGKTYTSGLLTTGAVKKFTEVPAGSLQIGGSLNNSTWTYLSSAIDLPACGSAVASVYTVK